MSARIIAPIFISLLVVLTGCDTLGQAGLRASNVGSAGSSSTGQSGSSAAEPGSSAGPSSSGPGQAASAEAGPEPLAPEPHEGFTSPVHEQVAGYVVFSKRPIPRAPQSTADFAQRFTLNDPIYARPFLADSLNNVTRRHGVACYREQRRMTAVRVNGEPVNEAVFIEAKATHENNWRDWMTFSLESDGEISLTDGPLVYPEHEDLARFDFNAEVLPKLQVGDNTLSFHVIAECYGRGANGYEMVRYEAARGQMTLTLAEGDLERHHRRVGPFLPSSPHREDRALRPRIGERVEADWSNEEFLGSAVLSEEWIVRTHPITSVPVSRTIEAAVVVRQRGADICRVFNQSFTQQARGDRPGYRPELTMATGSNRAFPCVNATRSAPRRGR